MRHLAAHTILLLLLTALLWQSCATSPRVVVETHKMPDTLRVGTLYSPTSFFLYRGDTLGYDYDRVCDFAKAKKIKLQFKVAPNMHTLIDMIKTKKVDLLVYEIPVTAEFNEKVLHCGETNTTYQVLVQPKSRRRISNVTQLVGKTIYVEKGSKYESRLRNLDSEIGGGINIHTVESDTVNVENLIEGVNNGTIPLTLADNDIAKACIKDLRSYGVDTSGIVFGGDRVGIYFLETGAVARPSKVVYDRANSSIATVRPGMIDWNKVFEGADWFHWTGITPALSQGAADVCLEAVRAANALGVTVSCDLNYRKNLWKYGRQAGEVMPALVEGCDIILGNEEDADKVFGIKPEGFDVTATGGAIDQGRFRSVGEQLMKRFPRAKKVIITLRGSINANHNTWGGVLWDGRTLYESPRYDITHIVDRVGGGDSFMGGLIYGLLTWPGDDQRALNFAVAASCLKHTVFGDYNQVTVAEVENLMKGDASGRVSR